METVDFLGINNDTLLNKLQRRLKESKEFDVLVNYFFSSCFNCIYNSLDDIRKIRILITLNTDKEDIFDRIKNKDSSNQIFNKNEIKENFSNKVIREFEIVEDTIEVQKSVDRFKELLINDVIEIRIYPKSNINSKLYICRYNNNESKKDCVINSFSNFSENELKNQTEFCFETDDVANVNNALEIFEKLWKESIDIKEEYITTINTRTHYKSDITPYQLYLKLLYEYFKEELELDNKIKINISSNSYKELKYQKDAVKSAIRILNTYNGVILSDVVGLGKTNITCALLAQYPDEKKLIICPPSLIDNWNNTLNKYKVTNCNGNVRSKGEIDKINPEDFEDGIVVVDEAHNFRNSETKTYAYLSKICLNKKVILVSATPYNNRFDDIFSLIKLFQPAKNSDIEGCPNLENFFNGIKKQLADFSIDAGGYFNMLKQVSKIIREKVLRYIMIRRTRRDLMNRKNGWLEDLESQGIKFPIVARPYRIIYEFNKDIEGRFYKTLGLIRDLKYYRYAPVAHLKEEYKKEYFDNYKLEIQGQKNLQGFIKMILIKRLESSFYAFKKSISRFIESHRKFIKTYEQNGEVYYGKDKEIFRYLENEEEDKILKLIEEEKTVRITSNKLEDGYINVVKKDKEILEEIEKLWEPIQEEPKLDAIFDKFNRVVRRNGKNGKIIIFTEYAETANMLFERLNNEFEGRVLKYSSTSNENDKDVVKYNFDPNSTLKKNDINILITTDVLAEGVNLHRSNIILNYDLPWNPTKVLQRAGRINRIGTTFSKIHILNCFPTSVSDSSLGLESNIKKKIQAFHDVLGSDAKLLTDDEELGNSKELFGQILKEKIDNCINEVDDDSDDKELEYSALIKKIKEEDSKLYREIKNLPKQCRTATVLNGEEDILVTFFRKGKNGRIKKFVSSNNENEEIGFYEAIKMFECNPEQQKRNISRNFYNLLDKNKINLRIFEENDEYSYNISNTKGNSNEKKLMKIIGYLLIQNLSYEDKEYVKNIKLALDDGIFAKKEISDLQKELNNCGENFELMIDILRKNINENVILQYIKNRSKNKEVEDKEEIILSEYFYKE